MKFILGFKNRDESMTEILATVNILLQNPDSFTQLFKLLSLEFLDESSGKLTITAEELIGIMDFDRVITIRKNIFDCDFVMQCNPEKNELIVCAREIPGSIDDETESLTFLYGMSVYLREAAHLYTPSFNRISNNSNSKDPEQVNYTPVKLGRFTFKKVDETPIVVDCGFQWELILFGGIIVNSRGHIKIVRILNTIEDRIDNYAQREIPGSLAMEVVTAIKRWSQVQDTFPMDTFSRIHFDNLPDSSPSSMCSVFDLQALNSRMGVKWDKPKNADAEGIAKKLFADHHR